MTRSTAEITSDFRFIFESWAAYCLVPTPSGSASARRQERTIRRNTPADPGQPADLDPFEDVIRTFLADGRADDNV
jgi:hypothetical protein